MNSQNFCLSLASILAELVTWWGEHTEPGELSLHVLVGRITAAPPHLPLTPYPLGRTPNHLRQGPQLLAPLSRSSPTT